MYDGARIERILGSKHQPNRTGYPFQQLIRRRNFLGSFASYRLDFRLHCSAARGLRCDDVRLSEFSEQTRSCIASFRTPLGCFKVTYRLLSSGAVATVDPPRIVASVTEPLLQLR